MIPVIIEDVVEALATAQNVFKIAFRNADTTSQSYKELGENIRKLAINLDLLLDVLQRAGYPAGPPDQNHDIRGPVLGNFKGTLKDCEVLLNDQRFFQRSGGFVKNLCWYSQIEPEVQKIQERITCLNIKFSIMFSILDPQVLEDRSFHIVDSTAYVLDVTEYLGQQVYRDRGSGVPPDQGQTHVTIPQEIGEKFMSTTQQTNPGLFRIGPGLDAGIQCFSSITKTRDPTNQSAMHYHTAIINLMMAIWILKAMKTSREYYDAARCPCNNAYMRQMDDWGMTIESFFDRFEQILQEAMRRLLGPHLILPPTKILVDIFDSKQRSAQEVNTIVPVQRAPQLQWAKQFPPRQRRPVELEDTSRSNKDAKGAMPSFLPYRTLSPLNEKPPQSSQPTMLPKNSLSGRIPEMRKAEPFPRRKQVPIEIEDTSIPSWDVERVHRDLREKGTLLKSPDPNYIQTMRIQKQTESQSSLILTAQSLSGGKEKETADTYDLDKVQIIPSYAMRSWTTSLQQPQTTQTILFRINHRSPLSRSLVFQQKQDMFEFQHKITGYKIGYDEARVLATSHESTLLGGSSRQDFCRLQLWYAPTPSPKDNLALLSPASPPPSTAPGSKRTSWSSVSSGSSSGSRGKRRSTQSIFSMRSSSSGQSSVAIDPPSYCGRDHVMPTFFSRRALGHVL